MSRVAAKIVDLLGVLVVLCPIAWIVSRLVNAYFVPVMLIATVFIGGSVLFGVYTIVAEINAGRTIGKRLLGTRVVRETGARISFGQAIVRRLPMFLQIYWIDVLFALFTDKSQRAFELLSKTRIVRIQRT